MELIHIEKRSTVKAQGVVCSVRSCMYSDHSIENDDSNLQ